MQLTWVYPDIVYLYLWTIALAGSSVWTCYPYKAPFKFSNSYRLQILSGHILRWPLSLKSTFIFLIIRTVYCSHIIGKVLRKGSLKLLPPKCRCHRYGTMCKIDSWQEVVFSTGRSARCSVTTWGGMGMWKGGSGRRGYVFT